MNLLIITTPKRQLFFQQTRCRLKGSLLFLFDQLDFWSFHSNVLNSLSVSLRACNFLFCFDYVQWQMATHAKFDAVHLANLSPKQVFERVFNEKLSSI